MLRVRVFYLGEKSEIFETLMRGFWLDSDRQKINTLWRYSELVEAQTDSIDETYIHQVVKNLSQQFGGDLFEKIDWYIGLWQEGAISLRSQNQLKIFSGGPVNRLSIDRVVKHELCHYYLRQHTPKETWNSMPEEYLVQYLTGWQLEAGTLEQLMPWLDGLKENITDKNWSALREQIFLL